MTADASGVHLRLIREDFERRTVLTRLEDLHGRVDRLGRRADDQPWCSGLWDVVYAAWCEHQRQAAKAAAA